MDRMEKKTKRDLNELIMENTIEAIRGKPLLGKNN